MIKDTKDLLIKNNANPAVSFPGRIYIAEIIIKSSSSKVPQSKLPAPYTTDPKNPQDTTGFLRFKVIVCFGLQTKLTIPKFGRLAVSLHIELVRLMEVLNLQVM